MKTTIAASLVSASLAFTAVAADTNLAPQETSSTNAAATTNKTNALTITTTRGVTYKNCKIRRVEPDGISISHSSGIAKIPFGELPREYATQYGYDPQKAGQYARDMAQRRAEFAEEQERAAARRREQSEDESSRSGYSPGSGGGSWEAVVSMPSPVGPPISVVVGTASSYEGANRILIEKGYAGRGIIRHRR